MPGRELRAAGAEKTIGLGCILTPLSFLLRRRNHISSPRARAVVRLLHDLAALRINHLLRDVNSLSPMSSTSALTVFLGIVDISIL